MAKIMIVDDAAFMRITIKNMLQKSEHDILYAGNSGSSCAEILRCSGTGRLSVHRYERDDSCSPDRISGHDSQEGHR